jgi:hypothetical protein
MLRFSSCHNVLVENLELDGNIDEAIIGGGIADGIQFEYDGIFLNACYNLHLDNLNIHHFGHDGIWILDDYCYPSNIIYPIYPNQVLGLISNTKIEYSGRNGLSWQGGSGLTIINSEFNYTGQSRITEQPGAGIDIEFGHSRIPNAHGFFQNCTFKYNHNHGLICDAKKPNHNTELWSHDYTFKDCLFVGCETGDVLWPNSRNFNFFDCNFYGSVIKAYDARVSSFAQNLINNDNTKFTLCNFFEEYDDPDPLIPLRSVSLGVEENVPLPQCLSGGADGDYLVNFGTATRVRMDQCNITSNFTSKLIRLSADLAIPPLSPFGRTPTFNRNYLSNCEFKNFGYNGCNCDLDLTAIYHTKLTASVRVLTVGVTGINNEPQPNGCRDPTGALIHWYLQTIDQNTCSPNPTSNFWLTATSLLVANKPPKCEFLPDPNQEPLFWCSPCPYLIPSTYPQACDFNNYKIKNIKSGNEKMESWNAYPNPVYDFITVETITSGEKIMLRNLFGEIINIYKTTNEVLKIDIKNLPPGVYIIQSETISKKIIKL